MAFGAAAGALVGGLIGQAIGEKLDEHDAMKAELASLTALKAEDNKPVTWESDKNEDVGGEVRVIETSENTAGNTCKTVNHILNINGSEEKNGANILSGFRWFLAACCIVFWSENANALSAKQVSGNIILSGPIEAGDYDFVRRYSSLQTLLGQYT